MYVLYVLYIRSALVSFKPLEPLVFDIIMLITVLIVPKILVVAKILFTTANVVLGSTASICIYGTGTMVVDKRTMMSSFKFHN
jgi:hypothetical protein